MLRLSSWSFPAAWGLPPGLTMSVERLERDVITCEEAAAEKHIPLRNELKTLILQTTGGLYALHIHGDRKASLRSVKRFLGADEAHIASPERLAQLGLLPGTVCPVLDPVWSLRHLVSSAVLDLDFVSTNNGTRHGYFRFSPTVLLSARAVQTGEFES